LGDSGCLGGSRAPVFLDVAAVIGASSHNGLGPRSSRRSGVGACGCGALSSSVWDSVVSGIGR
jgi:hypothetical protein